MGRPGAAAVATVGALRIRANCAVPHSCTSGDNGEPVVPSARMRVRLPQSASVKPAFMQLAKNAAPAPKKVTPVSAAKRHSTPQSGCSLLPPGLPS